MEMKLVFHRRIGEMEMSNFKPEHGSMEMWLVCEAIMKSLG